MNQVVSHVVARRSELPPPDATRPHRLAADTDLILSQLDRLGSLLSAQPAGCGPEMAAMQVRMTAAEDGGAALAAALDGLTEAGARQSQRLDDQDANHGALAARVAALEIRLAESLAEGEHMALELVARVSTLESCDRADQADTGPLEAALGECSARLGEALARADGMGLGDRAIEEALWSLSEQIAAFESRLMAERSPASPEIADPPADRVATPGWTASTSTEDQIRLLLSGALQVPPMTEEDDGN